MKDASQYPVTTKYGYIPGYPINNGFHRGEDRACPVGTPLIVNGVLIGKTGNTGSSTGPHLHLGKWVNGQPVNPNGQGFNLNNPVVLSVGVDSVNGKIIRLKDQDGVTWVYCHLSEILVKEGDKPMSVMTMELAWQQADIQWGWSDRSNKDHEASLKKDIVGRESNSAINAMFTDQRGVNHRNQVAQWKASATAPDPGMTVLKPGKYQVN